MNDAPIGIFDSGVGGLTVARAITDDVMVMQEGRIVEAGRTAEVLDNPRSDAARELVAAAPDLHRAVARRLQEQG